MNPTEIAYSLKQLRELIETSLATTTALMGVVSALPETAAVDREVVRAIIQGLLRSQDAANVEQKALAISEVILSNATKANH